MSLYFETQSAKENNTLHLMYMHFTNFNVTEICIICLFSHQITALNNNSVPESINTF